MKDVAMRAIPILFNGWSVPRIIDGSKLLTRRVVRTRAENHTRVGPVAHQRHIEDPLVVEHCPYGVPGDLLWVRETWRELGSAQQEDGTVPEGISRDQVIYRADDRHAIDDGPWRSSIFMPRAASRLTLRVSNVRVERVQDISPYDAACEGLISLLPADHDKWEPGCWRSSYGVWHNDDYDAFCESEDDAILFGFQELWDSIHGPAAWERNDWVWVVGWDRVWTENVDAVIVREKL